MDLWKKILIKPNLTILSALQAINEGGAQIALVVDETNKLIGTVTDGDIRQGLLKGFALDHTVDKVMNDHPIKAIENTTDKDKLIATMLSNHIRQIPIVDRLGHVIGLQTLDELLQVQARENLVVIMSGGTGKRLQPLTNHIPKPMLSIGGKPLLELNIEKLRSQGFKRFCLTVGYKAEIIKEYFGDGRKWEVEVEYIHEERPLGTAGALGALSGKETSAIIVLNGDLLTATRFDKLLDFHVANNADCTLCVREYDYQLPYGVVELENQRVISIKEKPSYQFVVNAGMYVFNPDLVSLINPNETIQMPNFLEKIISKGFKTTVFPLTEYWSDIGQIKDYEKACQEFDKVMM